MARNTKLKLFYFSTLTAMALLIGFQLYINLFTPDYDSVHATTIETIQEDLSGASEFEFIVVGNVNNSIRTFRDQILPEINRTDAQFVVSAGNAVSSGGEESYRSVYRIFERLDKPYVLTYGDNEDSDFGSYRFYDHFGPHFFAFQAGNSQFIFLDLTGKTPLSWQVTWLEQQLMNNEVAHNFVFTGRPLFTPAQSVPFLESNRASPATVEALVPIFEAFDVTAVFSADMAVYDRQEHNGVTYIITGGAGGLVLDDDNSFHHYLNVRVSGDEVIIDAPVPLDIGESAWVNTLDSVWSVIYTFFYVSYARFFLVICVLLLVGVKLHEAIFVGKNYYRRFEWDESAHIAQPKRIALFSNNYFPFVSGVTISIDRLCRGLADAGHELLLVVPRYDDHEEESAPVVRVKTLLAFGRDREFRLANLFQIKTARAVLRFRPDVIHVHHPFWLGSLGLFLGRRMGVPVVYTYHTRLEQYAHYVPLPSAIFRNFISHFMVKRFCNRCSGVIVPTYSVEEYLRAIGVRAPIVVQPTGIEFDRFQHSDRAVMREIKQRLHIKRHEKILVSVSRLGKEKNIDFLIDGALKIKALAESEFKLLIVGKGEEEPRLKAKIQQLGLEDQVVLVGAVPPAQMPHYYQLADLFVFASKSETQGMVILEAMSVGLPVVAVRSSGIDDVIEQGAFGYKTPEDVDLWAQRVVTLLDDEQLREKFSRKARRFAHHHDVSHFCASVNQLYARVMAEKEAETHEAARPAK